MLDLSFSINQKIGMLSSTESLNKLPNLRKVNRVKTIYSSLSIENNIFTYEEVTKLINGYVIKGPKKDIDEIKNAYKAYELIESINPFKISDLLKVHKIMMKDLTVDYGKFRKGQVGVYNGKGNIIHIAPPSDIVPSLIDDLFNFIKNDETNMLIKSCIFHYEFEFIHPFSDGNGRMGRYWQTLLLSTWKDFFLYLPIESIIKKYQDEYYSSIKQSNSDGDCNCFIEFMLKAIDESLDNLIIDINNHLLNNNKYIERLLNVMEYFPLSSNELMERLKLKSKLGFRNNYLNPALKAGLIKMSNPDKPTSKNQKYYKI